MINDICLKLWSFKKYYITKIVFFLNTNFAENIKCIKIIF